MAYIQWNDTLSVGISEIDQHHKKLVDLINQLHDSMITGKGQQESEVVLNQLVDYTVFHFGREENLMQTYTHPELYRHKAAHEGLTKQVKDFQVKYRATKIGLSIQLISFLKDWLTNHIMVEDKKLGLYLNNKGIR